MACRRRCRCVAIPLIVGRGRDIDRRSAAFKRLRRPGRVTDEPLLSGVPFVEFAIFELQQALAAVSFSEEGAFCEEGVASRLGLLTAYKTSSTRLEMPSLSKMWNM